MKIITAILLSVIFINKASAQNELPVKDGKVVYELIDSSARGSAKELNEKAKMWFANAFRDSKEVLQFQSDNSIIGKGSFSFDQAMVPFRVWFSVKVDSKDSKYRVQFYDITYREGTRGSEKHIESLNEKKGRDKLKSNIDQQFNSLITSLQKTMYSQDSDF